MSSTEQQKQAMREYHHANKERLNAARRARHAANKDAVNAKRRQQRIAEPEKFKAQQHEKYLRHRDKYLEVAKAKYEPKPRKRRTEEEITEYQKAYREANRERLREFGRQYREDNREELRAKARAAWPEKYSKHRASMISRSSIRRRGVKQATPLWARTDLISTVYNKAAEYGLHVDHIVPIRSDVVCGLHCWWNLQLLEPSINTAKSNLVWPDMPE